MPKETFTPQLAERELDRVASQQWKRDDGKRFGGRELCQRLWQMGVIDDPEHMMACEVGDCIKTGVSAYIRTA